MKTTALLMFSFIFITGFLFGKTTSQNFSYSDMRNKLFPVARQDKPRLFELIQDSSSIKDENVKLNSDSVGVEKFPGTSRYFAQMPNLLSSHSAESFNIKPDTATKQYLIIIDPTPTRKEFKRKP